MGISAGDRGWLLTGVQGEKREEKSALFRWLKAVCRLTVTHCTEYQVVWTRVLAAGHDSSVASSTLPTGQ